MLLAVLGVCVGTNQSRLSIQVGVGGLLKRQELKQSVSDRGGIECCSTGQLEIRRNRECKPILVVTQNKIVNMKMSRICLL